MLTLLFCRQACSSHCNSRIGGRQCCLEGIGDDDDGGDCAEGDGYDREKSDNDEDADRGDGDDGDNDEGGDGDDDEESGG